MATPGPEVSVVVPAHDAASVLPACLDSVLASEGLSFEVIVVNDGSTDDTERIARMRGCRVVSIETPVMAANGRNLGAQYATGDVLVFCDADEIVRPDTLRRFLDVLRREPDVDAVVGSLAADTPAAGFFSTFKNLQHHHTHQTADRDGATLDSGRLAIRRPVFEALGGFEPAFGPASVEDIALGYRMWRRGHRIRFDPAIQIVHVKHYTFAQLVRSDVLHRAIPWTGLMIRERIFRRDLNTRGGRVASVVLAWLAVAAVVAGLLGVGLGWATAGLAIGLIGILDRPLLGAGRRQFGWWFALRAAAFLPIMYFYQGAGLLAGLVVYLGPRSVARPRQRPPARHRVIEPEPAPPVER